MAEPIEVPFRMWTRVGPRNFVVGGGLDLPRGSGKFWGEWNSVPEMQSFIRTL